MDKRDFIAFWQEVHTIIDEAMEKKDRTVSVCFDPEAGFSVNVCPWPDTDALYEQYRKGRITANDFRVKMGLPMIKNAEIFMKKGLQHDS